ncbi:outer membrane protein OmpK [Pontiella sp.]|uniref:outer membrane protein OmpK n=1 Tax=Pontiella sp. TaxID=2837462 RepID=UPI00356862F2
MKRKLVPALLALSTTFAFGGDFLQWQDTSLTGLYGTGFEVDPETQQTLTIEHANGWMWGDFFWFHDAIYFDGDQSSNDKVTYYGEIAPRISAGKILKKDLSVAFVKDWLIAGCYEYGEFNGEDFGLQNGLIGVGVDLDVPGFDFFQLNVYQRFGLDGPGGDCVQITPVWKLSTPVGKSTFIFDGYADWVVNSDGGYSDNLHFNPQFKFDIGVLMGLEDGALLAGAEYDLWLNKYGIKDSAGFKTDQSAISALVQYHF